MPFFSGALHGLPPLNQGRPKVTCGPLDSGQELNESRL